MSGERACVRQSETFRTQQSGSAMGHMLNWGESGGSRRTRKGENGAENAGRYFKMEEPRQNNVNHSAWRAGIKGHIGDTYASGSMAATNYKHGQHIKHYTRGPINHSAWRAGERGHIGDTYACGSMQATNYKHGRHIQHHTRLPINQTWRIGEKGHIGSSYNIGSLKGKPLQQQQRQQQKQQHGPPTSPVQVKAPSNDSNTSRSPVGKVWEDSQYWEKRRSRAKRSDDKAKQRPTTHPRANAKTCRRPTPDIPRLNVIKARQNAASPKYPSIRLGSKRQDDEWDSELTKVIKLHSKDEQLRTTGQQRLKLKPNTQNKAKARRSVGRSSSLRTGAKQMLGREEQRTLRGRQNKSMARRRYRTISTNYGGNERLQVF